MSISTPTLPVVPVAVKKPVPVTPVSIDEPPKLLTARLIADLGPKDHERLDHEAELAPMRSITTLNLSSHHGLTKLKIPRNVGIKSN